MPQTGARAAQLAGALRRLGVDGDQRVATLLWNNAEHLEAYLAVPSMGAVLHTLNLRLDPKQLSYIANHAGDYVIITEPTLVPLLAAVLPSLETVRHIVLAGPASGEGAADAGALAGPGHEVHYYEELLAAEPATFDWPELDERTAAAMCYTSGTTGMPKGVVYSHRSTYLHAMGACLGNAFGCQRHRPGPAGGAHVPRQRLGAGLRGRAERRRPDHARPVPAARAAGPADRGGAADDRRGGPDHLERAAPAHPGARR